jgi:hypothetical protein
VNPSEPSAGDVSRVATGGGLLEPPAAAVKQQRELPKGSAITRAEQYATCFCVPSRDASACELRAHVAPDAPAILVARLPNDAHVNCRSSCSFVFAELAALDVCADVSNVGDPF